MREYLPPALTAALLSSAPSLDDLPHFDWKQILWTVASAVIAVGLDWLRRWVQRPEAPPGPQTKDPPT